MIRSWIKEYRLIIQGKWTVRDSVHSERSEESRYVVHKHFERDVMVSSTHTSKGSPEGSFLTRWRNFDSSLFVALFDFVFTEIAFTYALRTKIKQISKCLATLFYESLANSLFDYILPLLR